MSPETPKPEDLSPQQPLPEGEEVLDLDLVPDGELDLQSLADDAAAEAEHSARQRAQAHHQLVAAFEEAQRQIEDCLKREGELMDQQRRLAADFNNYRNRATRDTQMAVDQAEKKAYAELLPVLDNFERSLEASYQDLESFRGGVDLIRKQFLDAFRRLGVEPVPLELGDPFDALHSEALTTMENPALPDGSVAAVYEKGFTLRGQLLRPARVVVNRLPHDETPAPPAPPSDGPDGDVN